MITQVASEVLEDKIEIQMFEDTSVFPVVYHIIIRKNGEQEKSTEYKDKRLAYGVYEGLIKYYKLEKNK